MRLLPMLALLFLSACQTNMYGPDVPNALAENLKLFDDMVRWGNLENIYIFKKREAGEEVDVPPGLDNVRVTSYESSPVRRIDEEDPSRYTQTAVIDYVLVDQQVVRQLVDRQVWESDDDGETWFLVTPVPVFR